MVYKLYRANFFSFQSIIFARSLSLNVVIVTVHVAMVTWFGAQEKKDEQDACTRNGRHGNSVNDLPESGPST